MAKSKNALAVQIGGDHYKSGAIQPVEFLESQRKLPFTLMNVIKYASRLGFKGDTPRQRKANEIKDLAKIRHYLDLYEQLKELRE